MNVSPEAPFVCVLSRKREDCYVNIRRGGRIAYPSCARDRYFSLFLYHYLSLNNIFFFFILMQMLLLLTLLPFAMTCENAFLCILVSQAYYWLWRCLTLHASGKLFGMCIDVLQWHVYIHVYILLWLAYCLVLHIIAFFIEAFVLGSLRTFAASINRLGGWHCMLVLCIYMCKK